MALGTATARLKKAFTLKLLRQLSQDICYRCGQKIETVTELSFDHKLPWLNSDTSLFWDLDNLTVSHFSCNREAARKPTSGLPRHGTAYMYKYYKCKCDLCKEWRKLYQRKYQAARNPVN